ncbi:hypothetical protein Q8W71_12930 [Methylobacterium sp. NEAU 140]|uniref:hypothetical protein n=1 Tax=Methylobacterium sp. NEAU 140 TaxID=3064945 RepID=UPI002734D804|nr:hypothetical protein [Methylobacterium sp. NEAU 140]MDP4023535.1 hypothetical protein [Methylobacterium sp. NEAU 140]
MKTRLFAAAVIVAAASPALAAGIDSRRSPYPPSAYPGYAGASVGAMSAPRVRPAQAYRYSGQRAGGPAGALPRR